MLLGSVWSPTIQRIRRRFSKVRHSLVKTFGCKLNKCLKLEIVHAVTFNICFKNVCKIICCRNFLTLMWDLLAGLSIVRKDNTVQRTSRFYLLIPNVSQTKSAKDLLHLLHPHLSHISYIYISLTYLTCLTSTPLLHLLHLHLSYICPLFFHPKPIYSSLYVFFPYIHRYIICPSIFYSPLTNPSIFLHPLDIFASSHLPLAKPKIK